MNTHGELHSALLTDFYQLTMAQGYFCHRKDVSAVFDMFFRRLPFDGGYAVFAGLQPLVEYVLDFRFTGDDIGFLRSLGVFRDDFLEYLRDFRFHVDLCSVEEGDVVFPGEPLMRVSGNLIEVQMLETILLNIVNFQTLVATKSARIVEAARGRSVIEFGLRRAHGNDGGISATRAAFIGGVAATSNVCAGKRFDIPLSGTMAHSWVTAFDSELDAFATYAGIYPDKSIFLIDTYDTLHSGIVNASKVFARLKQKGITSFGVRIDSGDLEYLSAHIRAFLDKEGLPEATIVVSNDLDEHVIEELLGRNAPIDMFGVGTRLVTGHGGSALSGVYKMANRTVEGKDTPCLKISNDPGKITNPGVKNVRRFFKDREMVADLVCLESESAVIEKAIAEKRALKFNHPEYDSTFVLIDEYDETRVMLRSILDRGELRYEFPSLSQSRDHAAKSLACLDHTYKRLLNPHIYKVSITDSLKELKLKLLGKYAK